MFRRLISNLPFNPSLINQVGFYARRIRRETIIRRMGLFILISAMVVQLFGVISPPEPTLALSANDLIPGGYRNQTQAINHCRDNDHEYKDILIRFEITCEDIQSAKNEEVKANQNNNKLYVIGRKPLGQNHPQNNQSTDETAIKVQSKNYYGRRLHSQDDNDSKTYATLGGRSKSGHQYYLIMANGNLIIEDKPDDHHHKNDDQCSEIPGIQFSKNDCRPCSTSNTYSSDNQLCRPCEEAQTSNDAEACLVFSKSVANLTAKINDANGKTASAGDELEYKLNLKNNGTKTVYNYVIEENIADILEYSDLSSSEKNRLSPDKIISWPAQNIDGGQQKTISFKVKIKSPIPNTPVSVSDPTSFDLIMTNVFGNSVNVKLPRPTAKRVEAAITSLPNTGPTASVIVICLLVSLCGYFWARNRMLSKELDVVRSQFNNSGIMGD